MGQVFSGGCGDAPADRNGKLAGIRIYLEDGTFVLTDEKGMFHFEGVKPGVHVVQLDLDSLPEQYEIIPCEKNSRFAGRAYSQFVDLQGGSMWRVDFHVALRPEPQGRVHLALKSLPQGDEAAFRVLMSGETVPLRNLRLSLTLPGGVEYLPGSSSMAGEILPDPVIDGATLTYPLGNVPSDWQQELLLRARIGAEGDSELTATAVLTFDGPKAASQQTTAVKNLLQRTVEESRRTLPDFILRPHFPTFGAELSAVDKADLDRLAAKLQALDIRHIEVSGHTDNVPIARRSRHIYHDNFALSEARARSVARYLGDALHLPPASIELLGMADTVPMATNATAEGRALNRRVEIRVQAEKTTRIPHVEILQGKSDPQTVVTTGLRPGEHWQEERPAADASTPDPEAARDGLLSPEDGARLANRIAAVRLRLDSRLKPKLLLDGKEIPAERIGFKMEDKKTGKTLYSYIGVDFGEKGKHILQLQGIGPFGNARVDRKSGT